MITEQIDITLLQDAYCGNDGALLSIVPTNWATFAYRDNSVHLVIRNTDLCYSHIYTGDNYTFVTITAKKGKLIIGSTYAAPRLDLDDTILE